MVSSDALGLGAEEKGDSDVAGRSGVERIRNIKYIRIKRERQRATLTPAFLE